MKQYSIIRNNNESLTYNSSGFFFEPIDSLSDIELFSEDEIDSILSYMDLSEAVISEVE